MKLVQTLLNEAMDARGNPMVVQRVVLQAIEALNNADPDVVYDVVDPANPFPFVIEAAAVLGAAGMIRSEVLTRKLYPRLAKTFDDLYAHMSDSDYLDRFASPGEMPFVLILDADEVRLRAIDDGSIRKLVIPRETSIEVEGLHFTMQYPIEIRVMPHGGFQIVYDNEKPSPIHTLESNLVDFAVYVAPAALGELAGRTLLQIYIPVKQLRLESYSDQLNVSTGFTKRYQLSDKFYYARVYTSSNNAEWVEIRTTHSEQVFDEDKPTAVLKVIEGAVEVHIPQIYFTNNTVGRSIRVDVFSTMGDVTVNLQRYAAGSFRVTWRDLSKVESPYIAPMRALPTITYYADGSVSGGTNGMTFEQLREQVIYGAVGRSVSKTIKQLELDMKEKGYSLIQHVDNITDRIFLASRALTKPASQIVSSTMGVINKTLQVSLDVISTIQTVKDNGDRCTIESGTLFKLDRGVLQLVSNAELDVIKQMSNDALANQFRLNHYFFSPFHYVLDIGEDTFDSRVYYLDKPKVKTRQFIRENDTTQLQIATRDMAIEKVAAGYRFLLSTISGDVIKAMSDETVHAQLIFTPPGDVTPVGINGTLIRKQEDGERVFEFILETNFDVNNQDQLVMTNFKMTDFTNRLFNTSLTGKFDIIFSVSDYEVDGMEDSLIDRDKRYFMLPEDAVGVTQERIEIEFGQSLKYLWNRSRAVSGTGEPRRYEEDIPAVWETDVYETDPVTGYTIITLNPDTGRLERTLLHRKGDVITNEEGIVYAHKAGDIKYINGEPSYVNTRSMLLQVDLVLFEGNFSVVDDRAAIAYKESVISQLVQWVTRDLPQFNRSLLEKTRMWFTPKTTAGDVRVRIKEGLISTINPSQSFVVSFFLNETEINNIELRQSLSTVAVAAISTVLDRSTVRINDMIELIKASAGDDIVDVVVKGLGGIDNNFELVSVIDPTAKLNLGKRLVVLGNGSLSITNDVLVDFTPHNQETE